MQWRPAPFTATVSTAGTAERPPSIPWHFNPPARIHLLLPLLFILLAFLVLNRWIFAHALHSRRWAWTAATKIIFLYSAISAAGCGSSSAVTTTPPPLVTPSGTSTITITLSAMSATQQPLQLPPIQLTLTVK